MHLRRYCLNRNRGCEHLSEALMALVSIHLRQQSPKYSTDDRRHSAVSIAKLGYIYYDITSRQGKTTVDVQRYYWLNQLT